MGLEPTTELTGHVRSVLKSNFEKGVIAKDFARFSVTGTCQIHEFEYSVTRPRGLMDKASDFESEDCEFESRRGHRIFDPHIIKNEPA